MAAADSFVGLGLAPSPFAEAVAQRDLLDRLCRVHETVIQEQSDEIGRLKASISTANFQRFQEKMRANRAEHANERLTEDNEFLRQVVSALIAKGKPCGS
jgi:hypothetical protein